MNSLHFLCTLYTYLSLLNSFHSFNTVKYKHDKALVELVKCPVCKLVSSAVNQVYKEIRAKNIPEFDGFDFLENMCDVTNPKGEWLQFYDVVYEDGAVSVKNASINGRYGFCKTKCKTIEKACQDLAEELDVFELHSALLKAELSVGYLCEEKTDFCDDDDDIKMDKRTEKMVNEKFVEMSEQDMVDYSQKLDILKKVGHSNFASRFDIKQMLDQVDKKELEDYMRRSRENPEL